MVVSVVRWSPQNDALQQLAEQLHALGAIALRDALISFRRFQWQHRLQRAPRRG
jgi:hypothetical protein